MANHEFPAVRELNNPRRILRERLLILGAIVVPGAVLAACVSRPPDSTPPQPRRPESFNDIPLEEAIQFVTGEIKSNQNLTSLAEYETKYGPERVRQFMGHAYRIYCATTGSSLTPDFLMSKTQIGGTEDLKRAIVDNKQSIGQPNYIPSQDEVINTIALVYPRSGNIEDEVILINRENINFTYKHLQRETTKSQYLNPQSTVLGVFVYVLTHEPFHLESGRKQLNPPAEYKNIKQYDYRFTQIGGLRLIGKATDKDGREFPQDAMPKLDEVSIFLAQRDVIGPAIAKLGGIYEQYPSYYDKTLDAVADLLKILGYPFPLQMRKDRVTATDIIDKIEQRLDKRQIPQNITPKSFAFALLALVDIAIKNNQPGIIREYSSVLTR